MLGLLVAAASLSAAVRVLQTNSAGDNVHVIDPATNQVVGTIEDIEAPHGVTIAPDGSRIYVTDESLSTLDVVDAKTLKVFKRIRLSGRPNNVDVSKTARMFTSRLRRRRARWT
jgi:YVTN family beta-propeller protein